MATNNLEKICTNCPQTAHALEVADASGPGKFFCEGQQEATIVRMDTFPGSTIAIPDSPFGPVEFSNTDEVLVICGCGIVKAVEA